MATGIVFYGKVAVLVEWKEDDVLKAQAGDSEAFIDLMKELELPLYRMAWAIVKQEADCADVVQEAIQSIQISAYVKRSCFFQNVDLSDFD